MSAARRLPVYATRSRLLLKGQRRAEGGPSGRAPPFWRTEGARGRGGRSPGRPRLFLPQGTSEEGSAACPFPPRFPLALSCRWRRPFKRPGLVLTRRGAGRHVVSSWPRLLPVATCRRPSRPPPGTGGSPRRKRREKQAVLSRMEPPREDPLLLLHGSWVEVAPLGAPELPTLAGLPSGGGGEEDGGGGELAEILREAQMEAAERGDGPLPALKGLPVEDGSSTRQVSRSGVDVSAPLPRQREDPPERPPQGGSLGWPWPGPPEHLPSKDLACVAPTCPHLLNPALHRKRGLRDPQLALLLVPSLLLSHALAVGLGICIGKRLAASSSSAL